MPERLSPYLSDGPSWDLDRVSYAGPELSSKVSAASILYGFLKSKGRNPLSAFSSAVHGFSHAAKDRNSSGGHMCARFDILDQLIGVAYVPHGNRTPEEKIEIARASWPFMSPYDKQYEQQALAELK